MKCPFCEVDTHSPEEHLYPYQCREALVQERKLLLAVVADARAVTSSAKPLLADSVSVVSSHELDRLAVTLARLDASKCDA